jgi:hypothetical protein
MGIGMFGNRRLTPPRLLPQANHPCYRDYWVRQWLISRKDFYRHSGMDAEIQRPWMANYQTCKRLNIFTPFALSLSKCGVFRGFP